MTIIIVLLLFKSLCLYIQNIVLYCFNKLNPKRKYYTTNISAGYQLRNNRWLSTSALNTSTHRIEREQLIEQIRIRKRAAKQKKSN